MMKPINHRSFLIPTLLFSLPLSAARAADVKPPEKPKETAELVEVRFADDSVLKMMLREEQIDIVTPYGKLKVPFAQIRQIEFATRISPEVAKRIDKAIADLASSEEKDRDLAVIELLKLKDRAYPALVEATKSPDMDVKSRAEELLERLREGVPEGQALYRKFDTIQTEEMKIAGKIDGVTWKAKTSQFGDVEIKLTDLRGIRTPNAVEETVEVLNPLPDPGQLSTYAGQIGKKFAFRVTGIAGNNLYGTDVYTSDSLLANVAVHTGVLKPGQVGIVKVEIVVPPGAYVGSTRNGCTSASYGAYHGAFKILK